MDFVFIVGNQFGVIKRKGFGVALHRNNVARFALEVRVETSGNYSNDVELI